MKHQIRRVFGPAAVVTLLLFPAACGNNETVASKSAAAFREAQQKGTPVGGGAAGHHGGATDSAVAAGTSSADHSTMTGMDHSSAGAGSSSAMAGMDHSKMNMSASSAMAGMDHSNMPGMKPGAPPQGQQPMPGMDHSTMPGMQHGTTATPKPVTTAQRSTAEIERIRPATTLRPDAFDAPVAVSVAEAAKATQGGGTDAPAMDHSQHGSTAPSRAPQAKPAAAIYTCPMHPEVTSGQPGSCPKCGMALVQKK